MFYALLSRGRECGDRLALCDPAGAITWAELADRAAAQRARLSGLAGQRVGLVMQPTPGCFAALAALDAWGAAVFLLDDRLASGATDRLARELDLSVVLREDQDFAAGPNLDAPANQRADLPGRSGEGSVTILTSGTSGKPKAATHSWETLVRPVRRDQSAGPQRWLLTYRPQLYAGLQVVLQCWGNFDTLIVPAPDASPNQIAQQLRDQAVQCCSATPSYWRRLVLFADRELLRAAPLVQITLGGEVVDQQLLGSLREIFPAVRLTHIYATTELGRCFSVTDGRAGFPASFLVDSSQTTRRDIQMKVVDGELYVRSANAMRGYDRTSDDNPARLAGSAGDCWTATGDLVEVRGDRVYFVGRRSDLINVGGNKVSPLEVEQVIRGVDGVADVRVFAKQSSIAGQLVACEIVAAADRDPQTVRQAVLVACQAGLRSFQRPRFIDFVDQIQMSGAAKRIRRPEPHPEG